MLSSNKQSSQSNWLPLQQNEILPLKRIDAKKVSEPGRNLSGTHDFSFPRGQHKFNKIGINPAGIQCKLAVNKPGDVFEQQADAMAEFIVSRAHNNGSATISHAAAGNLQPKPVAEGSYRSLETGGGVANASPAAGGDNMDGSTLAYMSGRFGYDFSNIKIH